MKLKYRRPGKCFPAFCRMKGRMSNILAVAIGREMCFSGSFFGLREIWSKLVCYRLMLWDQMSLWDIYSSCWRLRNEHCASVFFSDVDFDSQIWHCRPRVFSRMWRFRTSECLRRTNPGLWYRVRLFFPSIPEKSRRFFLFLSPL